MSFHRPVQFPQIPLAVSSSLFSLFHCLFRSSHMLTYTEQVEYLQAFQEGKRGKTLWVPGPVTREQILRGQKFIHDHAPVDATKERLRQFMDSFLIINGYETVDEAAPGLLGQMLEELEVSTVACYIGKMWSGRPQGPLAARARRATRRANAKRAGGHARDAPVRLLKKAIRRLPNRSLVKSAIEIVLKTGLRCKDLQRLTRSDVTRVTKTMVLRLRYTKGIRDRAGRRHLRVPTWFGAMRESTVHRLTQGSKWDHPFAGVDAGMLNRALKRAAPGQRLTTYSFRRCFMQRAIHACKGDFEEAAQRYTMHRNPKILEAFYVSTVRFSDLPESEL